MRLPKFGKYYLDDNKHIKHENMIESYELNDITKKGFFVRFDSIVNDKLWTVPFYITIKDFEDDQFRERLRSRVIEEFKRREKSNGN